MDRIAFLLMDVAAKYDRWRGFMHEPYLSIECRIRFVCVVNGWRVARYV